MNRADIIATTKRFLSEEFEVDENEILPENNLQKTLDLDSLDYVDLVVVIEENLGFKPTADDFKAIDSFEDFYNLVEQKLAEIA
ncbi:MAG: acyl carrier protein [Bacteroidetes bacterium RIFCSPHIGHO2_02_FULL_44_7]|nr:MAG: acyl carrier protein [Bacteroidetes bacterium RIFCSPHIGHO2_02_FULL_44_7]